MPPPRATAIRRRTELLAVILYIQYNTIQLYTILYRARGVANGNNHFLLHAAVHPGLHCRERLAGWKPIGCYVTHVTQWPRCWTLIGCHHANVVAKFKYFNSSKSGVLKIHLKSTWTRSPVPGKSVALQMVSLLWMESFRPFTFGVNAQYSALWRSHSHTCSCSVFLVRTPKYSLANASEMGAL